MRVLDCEYTTYGGSGTYAYGPSEDEEKINLFL